MSAAFSGVDWEVHLVRRVLARAGKSLPAKAIQAQAELCLESTYAALAHMHASEAVRVIKVKGPRQGREWELTDGQS